MLVLTAHDKTLGAFMKVSLLILNWNGERYLSDCLASLCAKITVPFEVILVDNGSTDGSPDIVAERFPWVKLIRNAINLGFAAGNNLAARHATGEYLLLLNYDTLLETDILDAVRALETDPTLGAVGAAMYGRAGELRRSTAHFPTPARMWFFRSQWITVEEPWPSTAGIKLNRCDSTEGSFLLTRADVWHKLGGMDERNFMYVDDVEYCRNLRTLNLYTVQCPSVRYTHFGGYNHARMGYLFAGLRRYHRKFSSRRVQLEADFVLRVGLLLRIPWYWVRAMIRKDQESRSALQHAIQLNRNWDETLIDGYRYH
jgi:N-acetylglucosaminyl-diphospho-decaprenol L-rhamnosyltransferase